MTQEELKTLSALPLDLKIRKSILRIEEFKEHFGDVVVCFSGGLDSTVLLHLVRSIYPDTPAVCIKTLENRYNREFIDTIPGVQELKPGKPMYKVLQEDGFPIASKRIAKQIKQLQNPSEKNRKSRELALTGVTSTGKLAPRYKLPNLWIPLIDSPFKISNACCIEMKEKPLMKYQKENKCGCFIGEKAVDSMVRHDAYLKTGCNAFSGYGKSKPLGFWTNQDILQYIVNHNIPFSKSYGDIVVENGLYRTTKADRTGCDMCGFGAHKEAEPNRYQRMYNEDRKMWDVVINVWGYGPLLDFCGIPYVPKNEKE